MEKRPGQAKLFNGELKMSAKQGTTDWLLARILKWISDRLILYLNHRSIERTKLLECFQEYEGCLSAAKSVFGSNSIKI